MVRTMFNGLKALRKKAFAGVSGWNRFVCLARVVVIVFLVYIMFLVLYFGYLEVFGLPVNNYSG